MVVLAETTILDGSAILTLARMHIDAMVMFDYLHERVTEDEWTFRHYLLRLHFGTSNVKFLRASSPVNQVDLDKIKADNAALREKIRNHAKFNTLDEKKKKDVLTGEAVFEDGSRAVAARSGWDKDEYTAIYAHYSSHTHVLPMSFMPYATPQSFQQLRRLTYFTTAHALRLARFCILRMALKSIDRYPVLADSFGETELSTHRAYVAKRHQLKESFKTSK
jgi:hypothetical protein